MMLADLTHLQMRLTRRWTHVQLCAEPMFDRTSGSITSPPKNTWPLWRLKFKFGQRFSCQLLQRQPGMCWRTPFWLGSRFWLGTCFAFAPNFAIVIGHYAQLIHPVSYSSWLWYMKSFCHLLIDPCSNIAILGSGIVLPIVVEQELWILNQSNQTI